MTICDVCYAQGRIHKAEGQCVNGRHVCAYHGRTWQEAVGKLWELWLYCGTHDLNRVTIRPLLPDANAYSGVLESPPKESAEGTVNQ